MAIQLPARTRQWFTGEDKIETLVVLEPGTEAAAVAKALSANPAMTLDQLQAVIAEHEATPVDITGWLISWMVKRHKADADGDAMIIKTVGDGITIVSAADGICRVSVEDDDIAAFEGGTQYWEEWKRTTAGFRTVLMQAPFVLGQAVHDNEAATT